MPKDLHPQSNHLARRKPETAPDQQTSNQTAEDQQKEEGNTLAADYYNTRPYSPHNFHQDPNIKKGVKTNTPSLQTRLKLDPPKQPESSIESDQTTEEVNTNKTKTHAGSDDTSDLIIPKISTPQISPQFLAQRKAAGPMGLIPKQIQKKEEEGNVDPSKIPGSKREFILFEHKFKSIKVPSGNMTVSLKLSMSQGKSLYNLKPSQQTKISGPTPQLNILQKKWAWKAATAQADIIDLGCPGKIVGKSDILKFDLNKLKKGEADAIKLATVGLAWNNKISKDNLDKGCDFMMSLASRGIPDLIENGWEMKVEGKINFSLNVRELVLLKQMTSLNKELKKLEKLSEAINIQKLKTHKQYNKSWKKYELQRKTKFLKNRKPGQVFNSAKVKKDFNYGKGKDLWKRMRNLEKQSDHIAKRTKDIGKQLGRFQKLIKSPVGKALGKIAQSQGMKIIGRIFGKILAVYAALETAFFLAKISKYFDDLQWLEGEVRLEEASLFEETKSAPESAGVPGIGYGGTPDNYSPEWFEKGEMGAKGNSEAGEEAKEYQDNITMVDEGGGQGQGDKALAGNPEAEYGTNQQEALESKGVAESQVSEATMDLIHAFPDQEILWEEITDPQHGREVTEAQAARFVDSFYTIDEKEASYLIKKLRPMKGIDNDALIDQLKTDLEKYRKYGERPTQPGEAAMKTTPMGTSSSKEGTGSGGDSSPILEMDQTTQGDNNQQVEKGEGYNSVPTQGELDLDKYLPEYTFLQKDLITITNKPSVFVQIIQGSLKINGNILADLFVSYYDRKIKAPGNYKVSTVNLIFMGYDKNGLAIFQIPNTFIVRLGTGTIHHYQGGGDLKIPQSKLSF